MCTCHYCGKNLKRPCALGIHERTCKLNPNRKPLENHVCGYAIHKKKTNHSENIESSCKFCGKICKKSILMPDGITVAIAVNNFTSPPPHIFNFQSIYVIV